MERSEAMKKALQYAQSYLDYNVKNDSVSKEQRAHFKKAAKEVLRSNPNALPTFRPENMEVGKAYQLLEEWYKEL